MHKLQICIILLKVRNKYVFTPICVFIITWRKTPVYIYIYANLNLLSVFVLFMTAKYLYEVLGPRGSSLRGDLSKETKPVTSKCFPKFKENPRILNGGLNEKMWCFYQILHIRLYKKMTKYRIFYSKTYLTNMSKF